MHYNAGTNKKEIKKPLKRTGGGNKLTGTQEGGPLA